MIYLPFALISLWSIVSAFRRGYYNTVFFGRYSRAEKPVDFWFFISGSSLILIVAVILVLQTL